MAKRFQSRSPFGYVAMTGPVLATALALGACSAADGGDADLDAGSGGTSSGVGGTGAGVGGTGAGTGGAGLGTGGSLAECSETELAADTCDFAPGLTHGCQRRFALGINYAWHDFSADFGGLAAWGLPGVAAGSATYQTELAAMKAGGVSAVRWWMFPDFRGSGVVFDGADDPSGLGTTTVADIQKALELADQADIYLVLTLFSFDGFRPDADLDPEAPVVLARSLAPMVTDATRRAKVIQNVVRPVARAVATSPYAHRLLGWDVINEPEWAVEASTPGAPSGGAFTPNGELTAISLTDMKGLITETTAALHEELPGTKVSVGWAAAKWQWAFADLTTLDFHQPHIYAWVNSYWPYTSTPAELGYGDKPTVMGEFYLMNMPFSSEGDNSTFQTIVSSWYDNGYAGAWSWQYNENASDLPLVQTFATGKGCQVTY